jgi:hypothetical protein
VSPTNLRGTYPMLLTIRHEATGDVAAQSKQGEVIRCDDPVGTLTFIVRLSKTRFNHLGFYRVSVEHGTRNHGHAVGQAKEGNRMCPL